MRCETESLCSVDSYFRIIFFFFFSIPCSLKTWGNMALHRFCFFIICELWILGNDSGVIFCCLLHSFEFRVIILLDWLPSKARKPSLNCYLTCSCKNKWIHAFPKVLVRKWMQQSAEILTPLADSTFPGNNYYTTCTSFLYIYPRPCLFNIIYKQNFKLQWNSEYRLNKR